MTHLRFTSPTGSGRLSGSVLAAVVLAAVLAVSACGQPAPAEFDDADPAPLLDNGAPVRIALEAGLEQTLELTPARVRAGGRLHIRSVVRNTSTQPKPAHALVCHLEVRTTMNLRPIEPLVLCFAYSVNLTIPPGDSLVLTASGVVHSREGQYLLAVRHLLRPDIIAKVRINVHSAND
jgi:predicted small lipoprotein YifL